MLSVWSRPQPLVHDLHPGHIHVHDRDGLVQARDAVPLEGTPPIKSRLLLCQYRDSGYSPIFEAAHTLSSMPCHRHQEWINRMIKTAISDSGLAEKAAGKFRYSFGVQSGQMLWVSGQVALTSEGIVGPGDIETQTRQAFTNIKTIVESAGGTLNDLVSTTTYMTDREFSKAINDVRCEFLAPDVPPTSTLIVVEGLAHPEFLVEISAVAVIGSGAERA